jgi:hypothetical protein
MRKKATCVRPTRCVERIVEEELVERFRDFRISAVVAVSAMLLLGAGEAFAGSAPSVTGDGVGCFDRVAGTAAGAWSLGDPTAPTFSTEFGGQGADVVPVVGKFAGGTLDGIAVADPVNTIDSGGTPVVRFWLAEQVTDGDFSSVSGAYDVPFNAASATTENAIPIAGNWQGAGNPGAGLYYPDTGVFVIDTAPGSATQIGPVEFGPKEPGVMIPVVGDFNNDGRDSVGVYHKNNGYFYLITDLAETPAQWNSNALIFAFGPPGAGWLPVTGNWNQANGDSVGLYDPSSGSFYLTDANNDINSGGDGLADYTVSYDSGGATSDCNPVAGDWNIAP